MKRTKKEVKKFSFNAIISQYDFFVQKNSTYRSIDCFVLEHFKSECHGKGAVHLELLAGGG